MNDEAWQDRIEIEGSRLSCTRKEPINGLDGTVRAQNALREIRLNNLNNVRFLHSRISNSRATVTAADAVVDRGSPA